MLLLQVANDTITMSELTKVIQGANSTPILYYVITAIITFLATGIGAYLAFYTSKKQEKNKQKEYYIDRMKYFVLVFENVCSTWDEQKPYIRDYIENTREKPYDIFDLKKSNNIEDFQKLKSFECEDLFHSYLLLVNEGNEQKINDYNNLYRGIDYINENISKVLSTNHSLNEHISSNEKGLEDEIQDLVTACFNYIAKIKKDNLISNIFISYHNHLFEKHPLSECQNNIKTFLRYVNSNLECTKDNDINDIFLKAFRYNNTLGKYNYYLQLYCSNLESYIQLNDDKILELEEIINKLHLSLKKVGSKPNI